VSAPETREYGPDVAATLRTALVRLPEGQRQFVVLKLLRGARFAEIGETLGLTEAAAKMRFVRALEALRTELEREGVTP
jgi:DNA-directed RNA polymerase specialized sigma24 family protein